MNLALVRVVVAASLLLAGCAPSPGTTPASESRSAGSGSSPAGGSVPARLTEGWPDNGRRVQVPVGSAVQVKLPSTYWRFAAPSSPALAASPPVVHPTRSHVPGAGAGTVSVLYRAVAAGTARISASRLSCGEARRCPPGQGSFELTVVVH